MRQSFQAGCLPTGPQLTQPAAWMTGPWKLLLLISAAQATLTVRAREPTAKGLKHLLQVPGSNTSRPMLSCCLRRRLL